MNLVTGATGFVGAAVVRHLLARGEPVRALVRRADRLAPDLAAAANKGDLKVVEADLLTLHELPAALEGCRRVFHCAGRRPDGPTEEQLVSHGAATHHLLLSARAVEAERVVMVSSLAVQIATGEADDVPAYAAAKAAQEQAAAEFHRHGLDVVVVRVAPVFGPGGGSPVNSWAARLARGGPAFPARGERSVSVTYVHDVAAALWFAVQWGEPRGVYEYASETVLLRDLAGRVDRLAAGGAEAFGEKGASGSKGRGGVMGRGWLAGALARVRAGGTRLPVDWEAGLVPAPERSLSRLGLVPATDPETAWTDTVRWLLTAEARTGG